MTQTESASDRSPTPAGASGGFVHSVSNFIKDFKEIIIGSIAIIACIIGAINYFISRSEYKKIHCQIMTLIRLNNAELNEAKMMDTIDKIRGHISAISTSPSEAKRRNLDLMNDSMKANETSLNDQRKKISDFRDELQAGKCHIDF